MPIFAKELDHFVGEENRKKSLTTESPRSSEETNFLTVIEPRSFFSTNDRILLNERIDVHGR